MDGVATVALSRPVARASVAYRRILVPVSGGEAAVRIACTLAAEHGAIVSALAVIEVPAALPLDAHMPEQEAEAQGEPRRAEAVGDRHGVGLRAGRGRGGRGGDRHAAEEWDASSSSCARRLGKTLATSSSTLAAASFSPPARLIELRSPKRLLIGRPRLDARPRHTLLPKFLALPVFSSDPISSVAYATEAALAVLVASRYRGAPRLPALDRDLVFMVIVVLSYVQGVKAYSSSGGSYVFAKENLGTLPAWSRARR